MIEISVVTPTKDRPEAIKLCSRWFKEQTYPVHEHIIACGGNVIENLIAGINKATGDVILLADDDDYYAPGWTQWLARLYKRKRMEAAGHKTRAMYHLRSEMRLECNKPPPPGSVSFRIDQRPAVKRWMAKANKPQMILKEVCYKVPRINYVYRIMGLYPGDRPGRGLSRKHNPNRFSIADPDLHVLRSRIGDDVVDLYLDAIERIDQRLGQ